MYQLILVLLFTVSGVMAQTVQIHHVVEGPGVISVPVDMLNFTGVGAVTLYIEYDSDLLTFSGFENPAFGGVMANYSSVSDQIVVTYFQMGGGFNINGKLLDLKFSYPGGFSTPVVVASAEITDSGLSPIAATYIPGSVTQVTTTNVLTLNDPGLVLVGNTAIVPLSIEGPDFGAVNSISLKIAFNPAQLSYAGKVEHAIAGVVASAGNGILTLNWNGNPENLTSLTTLLDLQFVYHGGGDASLEFYPGSEVADNMSSKPVNYQGTLVSPYTEAQNLTIGTVIGTPGQSVTLPIDAANFGTYEVGAITLKIGFDPAKLTYTGYTPIQPSSGWVVSASGGELSLHRSNTGALTINDGLMLEINFNYHGGGTAPVVFNPGTELKTIHAVTIPVGFDNGMVLPQVYNAKLILDEVLANTGFPVIVPLSAIGFDPLLAVGSITIEVGFPSDRLTYTGYTAPNPAFSGWVVNSTGSQLTFNWSDAGGQVLPDGVLLELNFNYTGTGMAPVAFNPGVELHDTNLNLIPHSLVDGGVNIPHTISGILKYANVAETALAGANVYLMDAGGLTLLATAVTDIAGYYEFTNVFNGNYMLTASTTIPWGGVNIDDAIDVYDFWDTGLPALTGIYWVAADVNLSASVNIDDAIDIYDAWNDGIKPPSWIAPDWVFENPAVSVSGGDISVDIQGLCSGDVNATLY